MEETIIASGSKVFFEYGFLGVSVIILSYFLWKLINAVRTMVNESLERQRLIIDKKDEMLDKKDEIILDLSRKIYEMENKVK